MKILIKMTKAIIFPRASPMQLALLLCVVRAFPLAPSLSHATGYHRGCAGAQHRIRNLAWKREANRRLQRAHADADLSSRQPSAHYFHLRL